jgi:hypothetical protein
MQDKERILFLIQEETCTYKVTLGTGCENPDGSLQHWYGLYGGDGATFTWNHDGWAVAGCLMPSPVIRVEHGPYGFMQTVALVAKLGRAAARNAQDGQPSVYGSAWKPTITGGGHVSSITTPESLIMALQRCKAIEMHWVDGQLAPKVGKIAC